MVFSSSVFLILFLPFTIIVYYNPLTDWISRRSGIGFRNIVLLATSLVFYAWGEPIYVFCMILSILVTYFVGRGIACDKIKNSKGVLAFGITYHILMLFVFKYSTFIVTQIRGVFNDELDAMRDIPLPIGISFYTFQLMSYLFDVYYGKAKVQNNVLSIALYATMFPQLIAGPIVRYSEIAKQIDQRDTDRIEFCDGSERFIYGLGKKVLLADCLAYTVDRIWALDSRPAYVAWVGAICYTLQIYYDFSGYSDMAIGLGKMFGFHFSENFNYPYIAKSVTEFWRRWHISLSSWFRDYVYIPLGGSRVTKREWMRNIFVVWLLTGIWHGANWTFLCWGLIYFIVLMFEKYTGFPNKLGWLSHVYTMLIVSLAWVMFRSDTISDGLKYIGEMFGFGNAGLSSLPTINITIVGTLFAIVVAIILSAPVFPAVSAKMMDVSPRLFGIIRSVVALVIFAVAFSRVMAQSYTAFIYFNF